MSAVIEKIDKSRWLDGPWKDEPDRKEWTHNGINCLIVRVSSHGALCGYVGVPPGHPWHGKGYDDIDAECHGGLTYAEERREAVCHVSAPGEPEHLWWVGFDHAHAGDFCPGMGREMMYFGDGMGENYRDFAYATAGVESLADQAAAVGQVPSHN